VGKEIDMRLNEKNEKRSFDFPKESLGELRSKKERDKSWLS